MAEVMVEADIFEIGRDLVEVEFVIKRIGRIIIQQAVIAELGDLRSEWAP